MAQPVPKVTHKDVERIAVRDFGRERLSQVMGILREFNEEGGDSAGNSRVRLAILKLADGAIDLLSEYTKMALVDYRDVLAMAEYPGYAGEIAFGKASKEAVREVIDEDWRQYREWFERE